jgi:hypothetical protein
MYGAGLVFDYGAIRGSRFAAATPLDRAFSLGPAGRPPALDHVSKHNPSVSAVELL